MKQKLHLLVVIVGSLAGIVLLNVGFLMIMLGLLPTVVAYFIDSGPQKNFYRTVRSCNLIGVLVCVVPLLPAFPHVDAALEVSMNNPQTWLTLYGTAGAGWVLAGVCRVSSYALLLVTGQSHVARMERAQKELVKEWGEAITQAKTY